MGRRSKLTPETITLIQDALAAGATYRLAAMYAGIHEATLYEWKAKKPEFSEALTRAEGRGAVHILAEIRAAARTDWRAGAWILEKRYPQEFGKQVLEVQGKDGGALQLEATDVLEKLLCEVEARRALLHEVPRLPTSEKEGA